MTTHEGMDNQEMSECFWVRERGEGLLQDVDEALKRLPQEEVDARTQRLKRAIDLSLKHVYLPKELQAVQTPYKSYVQVCTSSHSQYELVGV